MVRLYKLKFEKLLDNGIEVLRIFCVCFWGPFILIECLYTLAYYTEITGEVCQFNLKKADSLLNTVVYILIIFSLVALSVTSFMIYSLYLLGLKIK